MKRVLQSIATLLTLSSCAFAQPRTFVIDPANSAVQFTVGTLLHTVHGTFKVKSGTIQFDDATGTASGAIVVDADSGDSGSKARDKKMKGEILETQKFPDVTLTVQHVKGTVATEGTSNVELDGILNLHGEDHPMTFAVPVAVNGASATADVPFVVPYIQWGLKNPSTFILRVNDKVDIHVHAVGTLRAIP